MATASHSVACICVVGALNQCLYLRQLNAKADGAVEDANEAGGSETAPDGPGADDDGSCLEEEEEEEDFKFHLLAHCALDVIEERVGTLGAADGVGTNTSGSKSSFLGLLFPTEEFRVYGYMSNTKMKYIIITRSGAKGSGGAASELGTELTVGASAAPGTATGPLSEMAVSALAQRLHQLYTEVLGNPFYTVGEELGDAYERKVRSAVRVIETGS